MTQSFDVIGFLQSLGARGQVIGVVVAVIALCAHLVPQLPVPVRPGVYGAIYAIVNWLAGNYRNASNAKSPPPPSTPGVGPGSALAAALFVLLLAGCTAPGVPTTPTQVTAPAEQVATDAALIVGGLQSILPQVQAVAKVPPATVAQLQADLAKAQSAAGALKAELASPSATTQKSNVEAIAMVIGDIATAVLPAIPGGAAFAPVVAAAQGLLPVLLGNVGLPVPTGAVPSGLTADEYRLELAAAAAH